MDKPNKQRSIILTVNTSNFLNQSIIFIMLANLKDSTGFVSINSEKTTLRGSYVKGMFNSVHQWQSKLAELSKAKRKIVPQVEAFRQYVKENPIIKMYFQGGLDQIPPTVIESYPEQGQTSAYLERKTVSYGITWEELLDQFAVVVTTPPDYSDEGIIGVPFYSLVIDLLNTQYGKVFFALDGVNTRMKPIFDAYGRFLDTPESLEFLTTEPNGWLSSSRVNYNDIICDQTKPHFGFESWHAWFTREIKQQARPFDAESENTIINSSENYPNFNMPRKNVQWHDKFWLKETRYSLAEMFGADNLPKDQQKYFRDAFEFGTVYQCYLSTFNYHRWRSPVSGVIEKCYKIGNCYFDGNPNISFDKSEIQLCSQPLLSMVSVRQVFVIKADNPKIGRICLIEIGMAEISGLNSVVQQGQHVQKGQLLGMFKFGGSSEAFVFDRNAQNLVFNEAIYERVRNNGFGTEESVMQLVRSPLAYVS